MTTSRSMPRQPGTAATTTQYGGSTWADMDAIQEPVQWDWFAWLPRGFLTLLAGDPGAGKSTLCLRVAASYIAGLPWPDGAEFTSRPGAVLWCESEGSALLNLDRARRWGLDPTQIISPFDNPQQPFRLDNQQHRIALFFHARRDDVRLVILDSLRGLHTPGGKAASDGHLLDQLFMLAQKIGKPILLTHHLRKPTRQDPDGRFILERLRGSSVIAQIPRVIWALHPLYAGDSGARRLSVIKNNLLQSPEPIDMKINNQGLHFSPLPPLPGRHSKFDRALDFLNDLLAGDPVPATQVQAAAQAAGLSMSTVRRAQQRLGITPGQQPGGKGWYWQLPPSESPQTE